MKIIFEYKSKHSDYRSMRKIVTDGFFQCVSNNTLPPIWFTDKIAYFSIEALHITFGHEADIAYSFSIHFNTKIMNAFFLTYKDAEGHPGNYPIPFCY